MITTLILTVHVEFYNLCKIGVVRMSTQAYSLKTDQAWQMADNFRFASSLILWQFSLQSQWISLNISRCFKFFSILSFSFCLNIQYQSGDLQLGGADLQRSGQHIIIDNKKNPKQNADLMKIIVWLFTYCNWFLFLVWPLDPCHKRMGVI